jgi:hypothetical protein
MAPSAAEIPVRTPDGNALSWSGGIDIAANEYSQLSSSYSADINGDDWSDLVSRNSSTGELLVYPHTQTFNGTSTFSGPLVTAKWGLLRLQRPRVHLWLACDHQTGCPPDTMLTGGKELHAELYGNRQHV